MDAASLRALPSVERLLQGLEAGGSLAAYPRSLIVACARHVVEGARANLRDGRIAASAVTVDALIADVRALVVRRGAPSLVPAVNATGIIIHTNLGRAPLSDEARAAVVEALGYAVLEVDPDTGDRGSRQRHVGGLLCELTGAEAAFVVNNNASAVLLSLAALARGRQAIVSRGELVEIGGSFRIPDIMAASGCRLAEVGTTNKTYLRDYEAALTPETALLVKVHRSNFSMRGFVHEVDVRDLTALGRRAGVPVLFDMGSGALVDLAARGLPPEPTAQDAIAGGADVVTFSGDKLLGGPQAGLIIGRDPILQRIRSHPIARAVRIDKLDLAALEATLRAYRDPDRAWQSIPVLRMLSADLKGLEQSARALARRFQAHLSGAASVEVIPTVAEAGGGALPGAELPSWGVAIRPTGEAPETWERALRHHRPPVFCRIAEGRLIVDVRTLSDADLPVLEAAVAAARAALRGGNGRPGAS